MRITEEELERRLLHSHWSGQALGYSNAAGVATYKAEEAFSANRDSEAILLRNLRDILLARAEEARKTRDEYKD